MVGGAAALVLAVLMVAACVGYDVTSRIGRMGQIALGLIIGSAAGNLLDDFRRGAIVDFVDVDWLVHWWTCNLADAMMVASWLLLLGSLLVRAVPRRSR